MQELYTLHREEIPREGDDQVKVESFDLFYTYCNQAVSQAGSGVNKFWNQAVTYATAIQACLFLVASSLQILPPSYLPPTTALTSEILSALTELWHSA